MNGVDIIILVVTVLCLGLIVYFKFIRRKGKPSCAGCKYNKDCASCGKQKENPQK